MWGGGCLGRGGSAGSQNRPQCKQDYMCVIDCAAEWAGLEGVWPMEEERQGQRKHEMLGSGIDWVGDEAQGRLRQGSRR